ncbi:arabinan endo-1,5-alpha-L-arabinosidase [Marinimicrobium agarilyticum]|uniref:arabinan endo-1,5-alpha-L-arabinosidase n=1 Tax=Marinimicrobium agarilyticum TaxID=306546 RepID=UPI0003FB6395|nr:arabinan endo-1,5-alpha-L-arabinosidase [Marinimicrobium agarilyticum]
MRITPRFLLTAALAFTGLSSQVSAIELTGVTNAHDPSAIVREGDTYFYFTTGAGIWYNTSTNLTHWGNSDTVFTAATAPDWIDTQVPENLGNDFWAPDVIRMGDYYYVYYSVSSFGSQQSAIGVVRTPSLLEPEWEDLGPVVTSQESDDDNNDFNAIDPALFEDDDGRVYMTYGSFFGGIALVEIDPQTGLLLNPETEPTRIYAGNFDDIEAPYLIREGDYYYLYFNEGRCCDGLNSTYEIRVAWSENIEGPYTGAYTILENDTGTRHVGPGHVGLLREGSCEYVSTHYYDRQSEGFPRVDILALGYDASGMPFLTRDFTVGECANLSAEEPVEDAPEEEETQEPEEEPAPEPEPATPSSGSSGGGMGSLAWFGLLLLMGLRRTGLPARSE